MNVSIVGMGPGSLGGMTVAGLEAARRAQVVLGAGRLLEALGAVDTRTLPLSRPAEVLEALAREQEAGTDEACVLVSGDVGLYSLAACLRPALLADGRYALTEHPGVSSLQQLCAAAHTPWQDALVLSAHGRACDVAGEAQCHAKVLALTGGATRAHDVCRDLVARGLGDVRVTVGENLSLPDERLVVGSARELAGQTFGDLACMLVENPAPVGRTSGAPCLRDADFTRGEAPMTKEEVRELAVCKLRISRGDTVWDVGAGTGSVSVECALAAPAGRVFAVECDPGRAELVRANARALGAANVHVVAGRAPAALEGLPAPDKVFVGGSSGDLEAIVAAALAANPRARVVVAAIALETLAKAVSCLARFGLTDTEVVQVGTAKAREAGGLHLMQAQNPVYLVSGAGRPGGAAC